MERHFARDSCLIGGDSALKEIRQFLNVLQVHERERILCVECRGNSQTLEPSVGHESQILAHIAYRESCYASTEEILCELCFCIDCFPQHLHDFMLQLRVPQIWVLAPDYFDHFESKLQMAAFVAEEPIGA